VKRFAVSVPATSANRRSRFDTIGLALDLRIRADVEVLEAVPAPAWEFRGSEAPTHGGLRDEMLRAMRTALRERRPNAAAALDHGR